MDDYYQAASPDHIRKERAKARELKRSQWWKSVLGQRKCYFCEQIFAPEELTMEHLVPLGRGGRTRKGNVVAACRPCNQSKKHLTPAEMTLRRLARDE